MAHLMPRACRPVALSHLCSVCWHASSMWRVLARLLDLRGPAFWILDACSCHTTASHRTPPPPCIYYKQSDRHESNDQ